MFLFRATHGKVLAGSSSFASQTTTAAGRHIMSNPIRSSERYESTATSATSLNQAHPGHPLETSQPPPPPRPGPAWTTDCDRLVKGGHRVPKPRAGWAGGTGAPPPLFFPRRGGLGGSGGVLQFFPRWGGGGPREPRAPGGGSPFLGGFWLVCPGGGVASGTDEVEPREMRWVPSGVATMTSSLAARRCTAMRDTLADAPARPRSPDPRDMVVAGLLHGMSGGTRLPSQPN